MNTETLDKIRELRNAANDVAAFWPKWREVYSPDARCDKKTATFVSPDERFASFSFKLTFEAHAGYYGNSSCSRIFSLNDDLAKKYFTRAIQEMAEPLFNRASELMLKDAAALSADAEAEIAKLQEMLSEVCGAAPAERVPA